MSSYLWKSKWLWPYESIWSIIEKFKYANVFTNVEIRPIFNIRGASSIQFEPSHYIYRNTSYTLYELNRYFDIKLDHFAPIEILKFNEPYQYLNRDIYYCPECIKHVYHSYLHQLKFIDCCIFHNTRLIKATDEMKNSYAYAILNTKREAYKLGCDEGKKMSMKFTNIPLARELIVNSWETPLKNLIYHKSQYNNIRLIIPLDLKEIKINNKAYCLVNKAFTNQKITEKPLYKISFSKCNELYHNLLDTVEEWHKEHYMRYSPRVIPSWYLTNIIKQYVDNTMPGIIDELLNVKYKEEMNTLEYQKAIATIILSFKLTRSRDGYEAIKSTLSKFSPRYYQRNCDISLNRILEQKIDEHPYSAYLSYYIFDKIVAYMFKLISNELKVNNVKIVEEHIYVDFNNHLPNYVLLVQNNTYYLYEC